MKTASRKKNISTAAFVCTLLLTTCFAGLYLYNIFKWGSNYPDFGIGYKTATGVEYVGLIRDHAIKAGVKIGDHILSVNGNTFSTLQEYRAAFHRGIGDKNVLILEREGQKFQAVIENIPLGFKRAFKFSGLTYVVGLGYILIGTLIFLMKPHHRTSWIFFVFTTILGLYFAYLQKVGIITPHWLETFHIFLTTFTPTVFIHLALSFPEERHLLKKYPYTQILPYAASLLMFLCVTYTSPTMADAPKILYIIVVVYSVGAVLLFIGGCLQLWIASSSQIVKVRAKVIMLGFVISASGPISDLVANAFFNKYIFPSAVYHLPFLIFFPLFVGYSIVKHDLFDFDTFIKRTYGYILITGSIAGVYGVFVLISDMAFGKFEITKSPLFPLVFILGVVFFFNPIRNRAQKFIDRVFYRLEYDYQDTVQKISETMRSLLNLDQIGKSIMDTALGALFIDAGCVMLLNKKNNVYECLTAVGKREAKPGGIAPDSSLLTLPFDAPFIQKIIDRKKEVTVYDIQEDPFFQDQKKSCQKVFDQLEAILIVPLIYEDQLTGLISLGHKKSGKFYRKEDMNLLNTLANQGAVAIENARMIEEVIEKERMEEELSIARDLQMSMLPAECPTIDGFEIAAYSLSAMEVGGDFYDFIEMGENKISMVIGDVTGKSVSGALVMSASRSVFRMLAEENLSVGEIMIRANQRTKKDIKTGMFVALLYAVLNAEKKTLSLCSAGQTQPVYISAATGKASLVETAGDTFPLGILEDVDYQETRLKLVPGDKVVLYTDGIVEAMNEQKELFGFERLLEVVQEAGSMTADSLLEKTIDTVNAFAKGVAQHDDLTIIVLGVEGD